MVDIAYVKVFVFNEYVTHNTRGSVFSKRIKW